MSGYAETYRGQVLASECNFLGHMNIQFYAARVSHAIWGMSYLIGISVEEIKGGKKALVSVRQEIDFRGELMAGDILHMETGVLKTANKTLTLHNRLINSATDDIVMVNEMIAAYMDVSTRKAVPLTPAMRSNIENFMITREEAI
ncbi:MAG: thioesterase family protein [Sneathiella sp.]